MDIELDRDGDVPLAVQLAWALRARIVSGDLAGGQRLPGVRDLAATTGVNVNTVRAVYARLEAEGLITARHGSGTFVSHDAPADERLADVARDAMQAAQAAGLDPRDLAAALYSGVAPAAPADDAAAERRRLRQDIGELELALADQRHVRRLAVPDGEPGPPARPVGRVLDVDELRAIRDDLAGRLRLLAEADAVDGAPLPEARPEAPSPAPSTRSSTAPGLRWTPSFGR